MKASKTTMVAEKDVKRAWRLVDAADQPVGRLAVAITRMLRGRDRPTWTPQVDAGDFVVVVNVEKIKLTGRKEEQKVYQRFSGYPSGLKRIPVARMRQRHPERILTHAVHGMLPDNHTRARMMARLKVYAGPAHPHAAQNPQPVRIAG
jgi:large subunit ribosomal protein L13